MGTWTLFDRELAVSRSGGRASKDLRVGGLVEGGFRADPYENHMAVSINGGGAFKESCRAPLEVFGISRTKVLTRRTLLATQASCGVPEYRKRPTVWPGQRRIALRRFNTMPV